MYKVNPGDVIPVRTTQEVTLLDKQYGGVCGVSDSHMNKAKGLRKRFFKLAENLSRGNLIEFIEVTHKLVDALSSRASEFSVCAKGCSHCCRVNVDVSSFEAAYIEVKTGYKVVEQSYNKSNQDKDIAYCPFHDSKTATCKIHKYRPITCRSFFAFDDHKNCEGDKSHAITSAFGNPSILKIINIIDEMTVEKYSDIRYWFGGKEL